MTANEAPRGARTSARHQYPAIDDAAMVAARAADRLLAAARALDQARWVAYFAPLPDRLRDDDIADLRRTALRVRAAYGPAALAIMPRVPGSQTRMRPHLALTCAGIAVCLMLSGCGAGAPAAATERPIPPEQGTTRTDPSSEFADAPPPGLDELPLQFPARQTTRATDADDDFKEASEPPGLIETLRGGHGTQGEAGWLERELEQAVRARAEIVVVVRMPDGTERSFTLEAAGLGGGRLRGRDRGADIERTLPVSSIVSVHAA